MQTALVHQLSGAVTHVTGAGVRASYIHAMTNRPTPPQKPRALARSASWRRDLVASVMLSAGILVAACAFATVWAATHPLSGLGA